MNDPPRCHVARQERPGITDEAIADTRRVWSPYYGHELTDAEAIEILTNVRQLAELLVQAKRKR